MATALERAAATAKPIDVSTGYEEALAARVHQLKARSENLLPIEKASAQALSTETRRAENELAQLHVARELGLPRLSHEPFSWRNRKGFPILAPFALTSPTLWIRCRYDMEDVHAFRWRVHLDVSPKPVTPIVKEFYGDVISKMGRGLNSPGSTRTLKARFEGMIPDSTREKIREFPTEDVFLVTEVPKWTLKVETPPRVDPLACLWRAGAFWLLDKFDTTSIEEYIAREFTT